VAANRCFPPVLQSCLALRFFVFEDFAAGGSSVDGR
jgi:hypothetical protein